MYHCTIRGYSVSWDIAPRNHRTRIHTIIHHAGKTRAYRMRMDGSHCDLPNQRPGLIFLGQGHERPDLALVREWFPHLAPLWDGVKAQYWDVIAPREDRPRYTGPGQTWRPPHHSLDRRRPCDFPSPVRQFQ